MWSQLIHSPSSHIPSPGSWIGNPVIAHRFMGTFVNQRLAVWQAGFAVLALPQPWCFSISIWWYRLFMLLRALWLAASLIRWLVWGWRQFIAGGAFRREVKPATPPALPKA